MRRFLAIVFALFVSLLGASNASAIDVGNVMSDNNGAKLHMNSSGDYVISWIDLLKAQPVRVIKGHVSRPIPAVVGLNGRAPGGMVSNISSGVAADGSVLVSWRRSPMSDFGVKPAPDVLRWAKFAPDKLEPTVSTSNRLSRAYFGEYRDHLTVAPNGSAISTWTSSGDPDKHSVLATMRDPDGKFTRSKTLFSATGPSGINDLRSYSDAAGTPTLVWGRGGWGSGCDADGNNCAVEVKNSVQVVTGDGSGGYRAAEDFGGPASCDFADFDEGPTGAAILMLTCWADGGGFLAYATRNPGGPFSQLRRLTAPSHGYYSHSKDDFPSVKVLPDGSAMAVWVHFEKWTNSPKTNTDTHVGSVLASAGPIGGELGPSKSISRTLRAVFKRSGVVHADPIPTLAIGPGGQPYVTGRLRRDDKCRIAAVRPELTLGHSVAYGPVNGRCARVEIARSGRAITLVPYAKGFGFNIVRFRVPSPGP